MFIREIWTQGRNDLGEISQWTRSFHVHHSEDGINWYAYNETGMEENPRVGKQR